MIRLPDKSSCQVYYICVVLSILFRLWLLGAYELYIHPSEHDGGLFISLAHHILNGEWLGPYDHRTLIKGPIYPLFIAASYLLRIPLLFSQHLLYCLACLVFAYVVGGRLKNRVQQFFVFVLLLFNPFAVDYPLFFIPYRMGLYVPLVVFFFGTLIETINPRKNSLTHSFRWSIYLGISFTLLWYTREESIWVVPSLLFGLLCFLLPFKKDSLPLVKRFAVVIIPFIVWGTGTISLSLLNQKYYGVSHIIDIKSDGFSSAYGGILRIENPTPKPRVVVTNKMREQAYEVSPTLKKLYPYVDGKRKMYLQNAFFMWGLRRGLQIGEFAENAQEAEDFWLQIGTELQQACGDGRLECVRSKPSIRPLWHSSFNKLAIREFWHILRQITEFNDPDITDRRHLSRGNEKMRWDYITVTGEQFVPSRQDLIENYPDFHKKMKIRHMDILTDISNLYEIIVPVFFWFSLLTVLFVFGRETFQGQLAYDVIPVLSLLGGLLTLFLLLTFVSITMWEISRPIHSAYPTVLMFIGYSIVILENKFGLICRYLSWFIATLFVIATIYIITV